MRHFLRRSNKLPPYGAINQSRCIFLYVLLLAPVRGNSTEFEGTRVSMLSLELMRLDVFGPKRHPRDGRSSSALASYLFMHVQTTNQTGGDCLDPDALASPVAFGCRPGHNVSGYVFSCWDSINFNVIMTLFLCAEAWHGPSRRRYAALLSASPWRRQSQGVFRLDNWRPKRRARDYGAVRGLGAAHRREFPCFVHRGEGHGQARQASSLQGVCTFVRDTTDVCIHVISGRLDSLASSRLDQLANSRLD